MDKKELVIGWVAVSVLWVLYWAGMTASLGIEAIGELVASASRPLLVAALCVSVPVGLFFVGMAVVWLQKAAAGGPGRK